jgi:Predicted glycosyltransferases
MRKCDIIVPIYNAYDYVEKCIESVIRNTNLHNHRLLLIDDKSPDERIVPYLDFIKKQYTDLQIIILKNERNMGFVSTVNKGMKYSSNDVLLLNSDTEVPANWLERIIKCADSQEMIATVTAMSNNATLASVPIGLQNNNMPDFMSFEEYADLISQSSMKEYPLLPSAHGFCMFIKQEILDIVGYFDEETFGRGYGEENDFSYRCLDYGFKHVLCDDVIVYHKESQSFNEDKQELIRTNLEVLKNRYPLYVDKLDVWLHRFPIQKICKNVLYNIEMYNRKNILFVIHDWKNVENNLGGTTLHCYDLIQNMRDKYNFHVFSPEDGVYKVYSYFADKSEVLTLDGVYDTNIINVYNQDYKKIARKVIAGFRIDVMHVHHLLGHYLDIINVANELNVKSYITLHDFYCLCPTINMLYNKKEYCLRLKDKSCANCLKNVLGVSNDIIDHWQEVWSKFLNKFDKVITPSGSTKEIIETELKDVNCLAIEHGIDIPKETSILTAKTEVFNVAFIGVMAVHKGAKVIEYLIKNSNSNKIHYHLFGVSEIEALMHSKSNYTFHGKYNRDNLQSLLKQNNIQLVCNLSIWPETYSYTLTETIACGVPVLGYNIGAVAERITKYGFGWLLPLGDSHKNILEKITAIYTNKEEYQKVIDSLNEYSIKPIKEMVEEYHLLYKKANDTQGAYTALHEIINLDDRKKVVGSTSELDRILNSRRWKLVSKISVPTFAKKFISKITE